MSAWSSREYLAAYIQRSTFVGCSRSASVKIRESFLNAFCSLAYSIYCAHSLLSPWNLRVARSRTKKMRRWPLYPADRTPSRLTLLRRRVSRFISYCAYRTKSTGCEPRALTLCSKSDRFLMIDVISSYMEKSGQLVSLRTWSNSVRTLEKICFLSYSFNSGTDCSR